MLQLGQGQRKVGEGREGVPGRGRGKEDGGIQKSEDGEKRTEGYSLYTILSPRYD